MKPRYLGRDMPNLVGHAEISGKLDDTATLTLQPSEANAMIKKDCLKEKEEFREESEKELEEETEEETKKEEEDDPEYFDTFPTMKELGSHEWLLKNP
ncbi:hypothetical protein Tco_0152569 [Tanacetum coccineum]